jgi:hypothetical protein
MHTRQPGSAVLRQVECGVLHANRFKQMLRQIVAEHLTARSIALPTQSILML